ncbi:MAG: TIGR01906 family membrane protein [Candidatus Cryosericum sp.]
MTTLVVLAAAATALAVLLVPFSILINFMPLQRLLLSLVGTTGGGAPRFGVSEALQRVGVLLRYLALRVPLPDDGFYSAVELAHMGDVQSVFQTVYLGALVSSCVLGVTLVLLTRRNRDRALQAVRYGGIGVLIFVATAGTAALTVGFDQLFITFHEVVFSNDFWLLPEDSSLIRLFPENYFMSFFFIALAASVIVAVLVILLSLHKRPRPF